LAQRGGTRDGRRLIGEFFVIVMGVLAALAVDQWTQAREDRSTEASYLARIETDLMADSAELESRKRSADGGLARLRDLFVETRDADQVDLSGYADNWFPLVGDGFAPQATRSVFDELISTGRLGLIGDAEVRTALLSYYRESEGRTANNSILFQRGRDPLMELGWEAGVFVPAEFEPGPLVVGHDELSSALRRAASFQTILSRNLTNWQIEVQRVLSIVRGAESSGVAP
jgi:hypothetical protein